MPQATVLERPPDEETDPRRRVPGVPRALQATSELAWRFLVVVAAIVVLAIALWRLRVVALPAFIALLAATALVPAVGWLRRRGVPRTLAATIVFLGALIVLSMLLSLIIPEFVSEVGALRDQVEGGARRLGEIVASGPFGLSEADVQRSIDDAIERVRSSGGQIASGVLSGAVIIGQTLAGLLLTLVLLFFFVKDGDGLWRWVTRQFPREARERVDEIGETAWALLGGYVRGVAFVATVDALFIGLGLAILGVPLVLPLATLTFAAAFIPFVGSIAAGLAATLVALVTNGVATALIVLAIVILVQQLEGNVLYPLVVGRSVELHPVAILFAVGTGAVLAGIIGALVAVPFAAMIAAAIPIARGRRPPSGLDPEI